MSTDDVFQPASTEAIFQTMSARVFLDDLVGAIFLLMSSKVFSANIG